LIEKLRAKAKIYTMLKANICWGVNLPTNWNKVTRMVRVHSILIMR